jgi:hypothetical protein
MPSRPDDTAAPPTPKEVGELILELEGQGIDEIIAMISREAPRRMARPTRRRFACEYLRTPCKRWSAHSRTTHTEISPH